jgi:hypothetical protein
MKYFVTRYLFPVCVVLFPIAGLMLAEILVKINAKCGKPAGHRQAGLIFAVIFTVLLVAETFQNSYTGRHPEILDAARCLREHTLPMPLSSQRIIEFPFMENRAFKNIKFYP